MELKCITFNKDEEKDKLESLGIYNEDNGDVLKFSTLYIDENKISYAYDVEVPDCTKQTMVINHDDVEFVVQKTDNLVKFLESKFC